MRVHAIFLLSVTCIGCSVYEGGDTDSSSPSEGESSGAEDDGPFSIPGDGAALLDPVVDPSVVLDPVDSAAPVHEVYPGDVFTVSIPFSAQDNNVVGGGIRFGASGPIRVVPVPSALGQPDGTIQFDVTVPPDICNDLSQICHDIKCYEFAVTDAGQVSAANIADLALACGNCDEPSCQDLLPSCQLGCDSSFVAGGDAPEQHDVELGVAWGSFDFSYDTASQEDRIIVRYQGLEMFDTGCVGASGVVTLSYSGVDTFVSVETIPNCADPGASGTVWDFNVGCPQ